MSFEVTTYEALLAASSVTDLIGTKIFRDVARQGVTTPYLVFRRTGTTPTWSTDNGAPGSHELDNIRLEVACFASTPDSADDILLAVRRVLEANRPTIYLLEDQFSDYSEAPYIYQVTGDFSCWHPSQVPS